MGALSEPKITAQPQVLSVEEWRFGGYEGKIIRTRHYRIYTTERDRILRDRLAGFAEHALAHYRTALARLPAPPQRLDTYLMDNRPQWTDLTKRLMGRESEQLGLIQRGGFASRGIGVYYDLGLYDTLAIAAHEGWHQYTQRTFKDRLPAWLEEGVATYMEGHRWMRATPVFRAWSNMERYEALVKAAREGELMTLEELLAAQPAEVLARLDDSILTYYAQLWALIHFLNEGEGGRYAPALAGVLIDASEGTMSRALAAHLGRSEARAAMARRAGGPVFEAYFTPDIESAGEAYRAFIEELTRRGGRSAIAEGRSPIRDADRGTAGGG